MKHRLSKEQAEAKANEIATKFMSSIDTKGWSWRCGVAMPDPINPDRQGRKIATRWVVAVEWTYAEWEKVISEGGTIDGWHSFVVVDISAGTASLKS